MDGSESAGRIGGDGDLRVGVPRTLSGGSLSRTPADVTGLCDLGAVPEMTRAIVMTLDDRRRFSEHFARVPTPRMAVGDEGIVKMVDGTTDDCRSHSPAAITTETNTTTTGKGTIQTRAEAPSRVPLSFSVESIMAGTVRRCSRPVDNTLHTANTVDDPTTTRFSVDNILSPVCVNRTSPSSLSPGRCRFTGVALTSQVPTVKLTSGVGLNSAWMPAGSDYSSRQGNNYGVSASVRDWVCQRSCVQVSLQMSAPAFVCLCVRADTGTYRQLLLCKYYIYIYMI